MNYLKEDKKFLINLYKKSTIGNLIKEVNNIFTHRLYKDNNYSNIVRNILTQKYWSPKQKEIIVNFIINFWDNVE